MLHDTPDEFVQITSEPEIVSERPSIATLRINSSSANAAEANLEDKIEISLDWKPRRLDHRSFPDQAQGQGAPPPTIANVRHLLKENGITVRYNLIRKRTDISVPGFVALRDNADNVAFAYIRSLLALHGMQTGDARGTLDAIASEDPYNPVAEWIASKPWDGRDRLPEIYATLATIEEYPTVLKEAIMYRWMLSAVAAAHMPSGFSARLVLTLQGPQSIGKTRWVMSLVPVEPLRGSVVKIDHHFDGANKDQILTAVRYWIVELGEVESSMRSDRERLKGIITRDSDVVRVPYAVMDSEFPRRTVFVASANGSDFLNDPSGSTRWGVVPVESVNHTHDIDMQQLWAQLKVAFDKGERWWFTPEEERRMEAWNQRFQASSIVRDAVEGVVDFVGDDTRQELKLTASDVLHLGGIERPTPAQARECGALLRVRFGPPKRNKGIMRWTLPVRPAAEGFAVQGATEPVTKSKFD